MIWHSDSTDWAIISETRWDEERAAAERRRSVRDAGHRGQVPKAVEWTLHVIEHMYYIVAGRPLSHASMRLDEEPVSDAEPARLFAVVTPEGDLLHVDRVRHRISQPDKESCASGR